MRGEVKTYSNRKLLAIGITAILLIAFAVWLPFNYTKVPLLRPGKDYAAYFAEASVLKAGEPVQVSGMQVGKVSSIELDGNRVIVRFDVDKHIRLGNRAEAAIKTRGLLGAKVLEITPRGEGELTGPIPVERTTPAYELPDALGELSTTLGDLNTGQLSQSWQVLADAFKDTPPELRDATEGVARLSKTLNARDVQLRDLLARANRVTGVLAQRTDQVVSLIADTNALLTELNSQSAAVDNISGNVSALARQLSGLINDNKGQLRPALEKLNGVLAILDNRKDRITKAIKMLNTYMMSLGESLASGPFFKTYVANLLPGQFVQPFVDAAFSDLGLDPNVLAPSKLNDPQVGQPGTPALPVPYPRTGQGGEPRMTIPDAITGNPDDRGCGPAGIPLPGPTGCYPYREPPPAPPPGGPPPGPPAVSPGEENTPEPTPSPVYVPAPNEVSAPPTTSQPAQGGQP